MFGRISSSHVCASVVDFVLQKVDLLVQTDAIQNPMTIIL